MKKILITIIKMSIMTFLLFLVLNQVHWYDYEIIQDGESVFKMGILSSLKQSNKIFLFFALFSNWISYCILAYRWKSLLEVAEIPIGVIDAIKLTFIGNFFSQLIPGMVGGDLLKAYFFSKNSSKNSSKKTQIFINVFIDRLFGVFGFAVIAAIMLIIIMLLGYGNIQSLYKPLVSLIIIFIIILTGITILLNQKLNKFLLSINLFNSISLSKYIKKVFDSIYLYWNKSGYFIKIFCLTFIAQVFSIVSVMLIGYGLNLQIGWVYYLLYVPLIVIISAIPITPGSVGLTEGLYLVYFASTANNSKVLVLAVLVRFLVIITNMLGGFLIFFDKKVFLTNFNFKEVKRSIDEVQN